MEVFDPSLFSRTSTSESRRMWRVQSDTWRVRSPVAGVEESRQACVALLHQPGHYTSVRTISRSIPEERRDDPEVRVSRGILQRRGASVSSQHAMRRKLTSSVIRWLHRRFVCLWCVADWRLPAGRLLHTDRQVEINRTGRITVE